MTLTPATPADYPHIVALMNAAFRGSEGWTVESYITGSRTTQPLLAEEIAAGALYLLTKDPATQALQGCVSLKPLSPTRWYLGALTVLPALQNSGLGRRLLDAAEAYARTHNAHTLEITVLNVRDTLIAWYERRGYRPTGHTRPFPYGDTRFGTPTRPDLHFIVLEKPLPA